MEAIQLGLERGLTAQQTVETIGALIERHGWWPHDSTEDFDFAHPRHTDTTQRTPHTTFALEIHRVSPKMPRLQDREESDSCGAGQR